MIVGFDRSSRIRGVILNCEITVKVSISATKMWLAIKGRSCTSFDQL